MSRHGLVLLGNISQLLLSRSNVRPLERCGRRLRPVTATFATLRVWPGVEQQQHRNFATSTTSADDGDESWRKKHEKHKQQSLATALRAAYDEKYYQERDLADRFNSFLTRRKVQNRNINIARLRKQLYRDRKRFNELKERLNVTKQIQAQSAKSQTSADIKKEMKRQSMPKQRKYMSVMEYRAFKNEQLLKSYGRNQKRVKMPKAKPSWK
ncbi:hypothetical protein AWZ03_006093 [Drosophila navojoa]|uniref:Uncharacterized protein n=1 Tax=Drosophila navojoa TaxID=7232 RepID=A0A484BIB3_DRONA|nr:hypothetical protein AWZ03_006093 [Drosophila navojoa]